MTIAYLFVLTEKIVFTLYLVYVWVMTGDYQMQFHYSDLEDYTAAVK